MATSINSNNKRKGFAALLAVAAAITMASCANDNHSSTTGNTEPVTDTATTMSADNIAAQPVAKMKKGKASAIVSTNTNMKMEKDKEGIYSKAEKMPEYPGGETALSKFIENNISYPQDAIDQDTEGTVIISFVVDEKGKVMNPVATGKTAGHGLDEEAIKIVKQMPAWKPGLVKGKPVKTRLLLPVTFKLANT